MLARCAGHHRASHACPQSEEEPALPRAIETQLPGVVCKSAEVYYGGAGDRVRVRRTHWDYRALTSAVRSCSEPCAGARTYIRRWSVSLPTEASCASSMGRRGTEL